MKVLIEEQGALVISCLVGAFLVGIGGSLFTYIAPMVEAYLSTLM